MQMLIQNHQQKPKETDEYTGVLKKSYVKAYSDRSRLRFELKAKVCGQ